MKIKYICEWIEWDQDFQCKRENFMSMILHKIKTKVYIIYLLNWKINSQFLYHNFDFRRNRNFDHFTWLLLISDVTHDNK